MRAAADADDYLADPVGAWLGVPRGLVFCARPTLWGFALWGKPSEADVRRLVPLLARELAGDVADHASLIDVRRLEAGDPRAFGVLASYLKTHWQTFRTRVTRVALVRPPGLLGATVAGFYQVAGAPYPVRVFDHLPAAAAWLRAGSIVDTLDHAISGASSISPIVVELRRWLDAHLEEASLAKAAKCLSRASRSLQRDLGSASSSFQRELDAARLRLAKRLLADTDSPITEIAYDVGCASPQHFSTLFRRVEKVTPSVYRTRARARSARDPRASG
ncbi:MAG: helix-turn-helix domain-containing protein [Deltaproteobacteria bacterium]|nr:helix-turn-helix domain-containing protein [Deltaproteobacteria bacterium]